LTSGSYSFANSWKVGGPYFGSPCRSISIAKHVISARTISSKMFKKIEDIIQVMRKIIKKGPIAIA